ncbi:Alpha/Beta hydrolase protein [Aspergillus spectabilis]
MKLCCLVDGNALFLTATEALRRRQSHRPRETGTIVVAIGYPPTDSVFSPRRSYDLTPPCESYTPPDGPDGKPKMESHGGADKFLTFITEVVRPFIEAKVFPGVFFARTAIFGHSYGGLFVLHTLFTRPSAFNVYLAAILRLSFGSREQYPVREPGESLEKFQKRQGAAQRRRMADNCRELHAQLLATDRLRTQELREYLDEDHGSVIAPALSGALLFLSSISATQSLST